MGSDKARNVLFVDRSTHEKTVERVKAGDLTSNSEGYVAKLTSSMKYIGLSPFKTTLKGGLEITVRDVFPKDSDLISVGFEQLSDQSRYFRFMTARKDLSKAELVRFSALNNRNHAAIGGFCLSGQEPQPVGIARYVRTDPEGTEAELAITVVDKFQHRGVGTLLLGALAKNANANGIERFIALMCRTNSAMRELLQAV